MRVIPVIDLMRGQVVRGVAGRREEYRPIESVLCDNPSPAAVGDAFRRFGFSEAYVADLDAIAGADPDWHAYEALMERGLRLLVDAGVGTRQRATALASFVYRGRQLASVVVGLETIVEEAELTAATEAVTPNRLIFSLDLQGGAPLTRVRHWQHLSAEAIAEKAIELGAGRIIVLDLARVGVNEGIGTAGLCRRLREAHPDLEIISGGGVRSVEDLDSLANAGCDAALVASAMHDGRLSPSDLARFSAR